MQQTKLGSLYESFINILIGAVVALVSQLLVFPFYGINVPLETNLWIMGWFTIISIIRSFIIRRYFNAKLHKLAQRLAE